MTEAVQVVTWAVAARSLRTGLSTRTPYGVNANMSV